MCRPTHGLWDVKWGGDLKPAPRTGLDNEQQGAGNSGSTQGWAGGGGNGPLKRGKGASEVGADQAVWSPRGRSYDRRSQGGPAVREEQSRGEAGRALQGEREAHWVLCRQEAEYHEGCGTSPGGFRRG